MLADGPPVAGQCARYRHLADRVQVADAPVELLERVLRRLAVALRLVMAIVVRHPRSPVEHRLAAALGRAGGAAPAGRLALGAGGLVARQLGPGLQDAAGDGVGLAG